MSDSQDGPDHGARVLGRLEGRVDALDERMDRHEASISARLSSIEAKLDTVVTTLASSLGGIRVFHWIGGVVIALAGFVANHFWRERN
jgi:hypothetical protein